MTKEQRSSYDSEMYFSLVNRGLCPRCAQPLADGKRMCKDCLEKMAAYHRARRNRLKEQGLCVRCMKPALPDHTMCEACNEAHKKRIHDRYQRRKNDS